MCLKALTGTNWDLKSKTLDYTTFHQLQVSHFLYGTWHVKVQMKINSTRPLIL